MMGDGHVRRVLAVLLTVLFVSGACVAGSETKRTATGFYFDTVVTLTAYTDDPELLNEALEECARYEGLLSKTLPESDVWRINHAGGQPVTVSDETAEVLELAQMVSRLAGGAFDATVAPAMALWDFTGDDPKVPDPAELAEAAQKVDYTKLILAGNAVTLPEGMQIDLGGVAKGWIADKIAELLRQRGVTSGLLNFGGNVVTIGEKPDGAGAWRVGIQNPEEPRGDHLVALYAKDLAVVTSGTYERGFDLDGVRYHHILDPDTGMPVQNGLTGVTVVGPDSGLDDGLSTALFVLGLEEGIRLVDSMEGVEALFITDEGKIMATPGAAALVVS